MNRFGGASAVPAVDGGELSGAVRTGSGLWLWLWLLLGAYAVYGTGVMSDDFPQSQTQDHSAALVGPVLLLVREGFYGFIAHGQYVYIELIKTLVVSLSLLLSYRFFALFQQPAVAMVAAFLFVFLPVHDGATYWYTGQSYLLTGGLYLYAYVLLQQGHGRFAVAAALAASFMGYGSTPYALGVSYLAWRRQGLKAASSLLVPNLIYIAYYVVLTKVFGVGISRLPDHASVLALAKQFALQVATGLDALVGPSMWLKLALSASEVSWPSGLVALAVLALLIWPVQAGARFAPTIDRDLALGLLVVMVASWGMFAVTGLYPQMAFNLGDRVTLWGSLPLAYLIACLAARNKLLFGGAVAALVLSVLGNADHWKRWDAHQQQVIGQIRANPAFDALTGQDLVFVVGNHYSKLGPVSHIEFMSEDYSTAAVFKHALGDRYKFAAVPLSSLCTYEAGVVVNRKTSQRYPVGPTAYIYDSEADRLTTVEQGALAGVVASLPKERRHWIQLLDQGGVVARLAVFLMPRLQYAF